jgi:hypothetical protein
MSTRLTLLSRDTRSFLAFPLALCYPLIRIDLQGCLSMLCCDTGSLEAIPAGMKRIDMTVAEAQHIGNAFKAIREYPHGHGNGEVCIPLINGFVKKLRVAFEDFIDQHQQKKH